MSDLALIYKDGMTDLDLSGSGAVMDAGLRTAVIVSLFTDRRAGAADEPPDGTDDRRGWWGDVYPAVDNDLIGSRLWLLDRAKQTSANLRRAEAYAQEALAWLVEDGVLASVAVVASYPRTGVLLLRVRLRDTDGNEEDYSAVLAEAGKVGRFYETDLGIDDETGSGIVDETGSLILDNPLGRL